MKSTLTTACLTALLALANLAYSQTTALDNPLVNPSHEGPPPTSKTRVENLKARHTEALVTLTAALNRITGDPALVTAKETFSAIDKADRDMDHCKSDSNSILASLRSAVAAIRADSAYTDDQKTELETAAIALADECVTVRHEAEAVIRNLAKAYKVLPQAKKVYRSYLNLQGEGQARAKLKIAVGEYVKSLTQSPAEAQPAETTKEGKQAA
jgi:hypothetical protein